MEAMLVLTWMLLPKPWSVTVPMPDLDTCFEAIGEAQREFYRVRAHCSPPRQPGNVFARPVR